MNYTVKYPIALASCFLWIGFVGAISFMEAWLKFQAPGVDLPTGLGIGKLVFSALNKMEWGAAILIIGNILWTKDKLLIRRNLWYLLPLLLLIIQTSYVIPVLNARADLYIQNQVVPPSNIHFFYVAMEFIKVISLLIFGIKLFNKKT